MKKLIVTLISLIFISLSQSPSYATHECPQTPFPYVPDALGPFPGVPQLDICKRPQPPGGCLPQETPMVLPGESICFVDRLDNHALPGSGLMCANFLTCLAGIGLPGLQTNFSSEQGLVGNLISAVIPVILGLAGFLTAIFIVISGIQFITSGGDPKGASAAKDRLVYALIGFVLIILAFAILQIIDRVFLGGTGVA